MSNPAPAPAVFTYNVYWGALYGADGKLVGFGYSGQPSFLNNPDAEQYPAQGPLPRGLYKLQGPLNDPKLGPHVFKLVPDAGNKMFDRSGFFVHGDNAKVNHSASEGCIIMPITVRSLFANGDLLKVVS